MIRESIYDVCNNICPTYSLGQIGGQITENVFILERRQDLPSYSNNSGHWNMWRVHIFSPISFLEVDKLSHTLLEALREVNCEIVNVMGGDHYDKSFNAFFSSVTVRTPVYYK